MFVFTGAKNKAWVCLRVVIHLVLTMWEKLQVRYAGLFMGYRSFALTVSEVRFKRFAAEFINCLTETLSYDKGLTLGVCHPNYFNIQNGLLSPYSNLHWCIILNPYTKHIFFLSCLQALYTLVAHLSLSRTINKLMPVRFHCKRPQRGMALASYGEACYNCTSIIFPLLFPCIYWVGFSYHLLI